MHPDGIILESKCTHMPTQKAFAGSGQILLVAHQHGSPALETKLLRIIGSIGSLPADQFFLFCFFQFTMYNIYHVQYFLDIVSLCVYP